MFWHRTLVVITFLSTWQCAEDWTFPPGFKFGAASAAYQVEGAWNVSDKGEGIWDRYTHANPEVIGDLSNGDVACDSYHLWARDIEIAKELGLHYYRFSISWPRLLPTGFNNYISEDAAAYYNNLIDGLLAEGIDPFITLYHWDLPQSLQDLGGWTNPLVVDWFVDYARVAYSLFGDRVKLWLTINEPISICDAAYDVAAAAPGFVSPDQGTHLCSKYILLSHAKAYRLYDEEFKPKYEGKVSLANHLVWYEPLTEDDVDLTELARQHSTGRYSHAIYSKEGGWPPSIEKAMEEYSVKKGYNKSVLPAFTQEEIELIKGTYDFYAVNHYTSRTVRKVQEDEEIVSGFIANLPNINAVLSYRPEWTPTPSSWFYINPEGIRKQLVWLKQQYGDIEFLITENGLATHGGLDDQDRIDYYEAYLKQILLAIKEDGVNVTHYTAWTLIDNFEWGDGYSVKYGLYEVDFTDPQRTRTPKASAEYYATIIKSHSLDVQKPIAVLEENIL